MNVSIRVDVSVDIGAGHLMRCLALAQELQRGGHKCLFIIASALSSVSSMLEDEGLRFITIDVEPGTSQDCTETARSAMDHGSGWIVLDGYHFSDSYMRCLRDAGFSTLRIDDGGAEELSADLIVNQNLYADPSMYPSIGQATELLLGTRYTLLRKEFVTGAVQERRPPTSIRNILVTVGATDPAGVLVPLMQILHGDTFRDFSITIAVGSSAPSLPVILKYTDTDRIRIVTDTRDMRGLMEWSDVAITGGGSTCWELARLSTPFLALLLAENQRGNVDAFEREDLVPTFRWLDNPDITELMAAIDQLVSMTPTEWRSRSHRLRLLMDGEGASRVVASMKRRHTIALRAADWSDCDKIFQWINDLQVRRYSFSTAPITIDEHRSWYEDRLNDPASMILIATDADDRPLGQIRFLMEDGEATVSVMLDETARGCGLGQELIRRGTGRLFALTDTARVRALVKPENRASIQAFTSAKFREVPDSPTPGSVCLIKERGH